MIENAENMSRKETKGFEAVKRYQAARKELMRRADSCKGKDETRRAKLLKSVANMRAAGSLSTDSVRRKAAIAEIDLELDRLNNGGKRDGKK